jgi:hypothetical protein
MNIDNLKLTKFGIITGSGRSGTTLLTKILNSHSQIIAPTAEQLFLVSYLYQFKSKKSFTKNEILTIVSNLWNLMTISKYIWNIDERILLNDLLENKNKLTFELLLKIIFCHFNKPLQNTSHPKYIIDKNPNYVYFINDISNAFPDAKVIFIVRDYRGRYNSLKRLSQRFVRPIGISWIDHQNNILKFIEKNPSKSLLIKYEDLIENNKHTIRKVCAFLDLEFEETMLNYSEYSKVDYKSLPVKEQYIESQLKWHENSNKPLNSTLAYKWKSELTKNEIKILDYYCGKTGEIFGYEPIYKNFTISEKIMIELFHRPQFILIYGFPFVQKYFFHLPVKIQRVLIRTAKKISGIE